MYTYLHTGTVGNKKKIIRYILPADYIYKIINLTFSIA